jgi:serine phosphatase RsbU (regulator of sigma subunit)
MQTSQTSCPLLIASDSVSGRGDFLEIATGEEDRIAVAMGNLALSGLAGAILRRGLDGALKSMLARRLELPVAAAELNRILWDVAPDNTFAAFFSACVDPHALTLHYVNAGHEAAMILRASGHAGVHIDRLEPHATILGLSRRSEYREKKTRFEPGDTLVIVSEGAGESAEKLLRKHFASPRDLASRLVDAGNPALDRTAVVVRHGDRPAILPAPSHTGQSRAASVAAPYRWASAR